LADNSFTHLVVVGSSAGGIGALSGLVSSLPEDFDAPIVVTQHLDPNRESHLQEILARKSTVTVKTVTEHEPLQAGVVYVVPANWHVNITDSEIELSSEQLSGQPMPSINLLMETAAGVYGENLIAVVLSGTGTDGTEGARTISQAGGTLIIQDPETADFGEMPLSLAPSTVDIVASLEEIGPVLKNLISGIAVRKEAPEEEGRELEQTRNLSAELRRSETENGLVPALQDLLEVAVPDEVDAELSISGAESLLPEHQRGQLYVILREAVRNAARHSGCRHLTVGVDITPEEVSGYVEDDGRGFEGNGDGNGGLGLRSIKERTALLDGTARVYSSPQGGAGVRVLLPLRGGGG
jgi:CheB methylesterase/Histidine kinase-, DNA gyrase B-, and HSP90-like ATPase